MVAGAVNQLVLVLVLGIRAQIHVERYRVRELVALIWGYHAPITLTTLHQCWSNLAIQLMISVFWLNTNQVLNLSNDLILLFRPKWVLVEFQFILIFGAWCWGASFCTNCIIVVEKDVLRGVLHYLACFTFENLRTLFFLTTNNNFILICVLRKVESHLVTNWH